MSKEKILYIGPRITTVRGGADQVNMRNQRLLESIFTNGVEYIDSEKSSIIGKLTFGITNRTLSKINSLLLSGQYSDVFIPQSLCGRAARFIKMNYPNIRIVTFFHNIEIQYAAEYRKTAGIRSLPFYLCVKYWEKECCNNSDLFITLNQRDSELLKRIYKRDVVLELPTSFDDKYDDEKASRIADKPGKSIDYLFVGVAFFANIQGVQWFIDNVMPHVKGHLHVVGKGMDQVKWSNLTQNVHIHGFVDDLSEFYYRSRMVVSPIFVGGGMKTKTAEALMYGKTILGSSEAFEGYNIDKRCMHLCNDAQEFVNKIKTLSDCPHKNMYSRELFMNYYSNEIAVVKLNSILV